MSNANNTILTCPGDTIQETIDYINMSQRELAERLGYPTNKLNQLIKGEISLTPDMARKLENVLGIPVRTWLELERMFQEEKLQIEAKQKLEAQIGWLNKFPLQILKELGVISQGKATFRHVEQLLSFFKVASHEEWEHIYLENEVSVAFKISLAQTNNPYSLSSWLRFGEVQAKDIFIDTPFDQEEFKRTLEAAKELSYHQSDNFKEQLQKICAKCGVAVVFTPLFPKAPVNGATRWLKKRTLPLIQLSDRYKYADHFWFAFFHEAAHILKHGKTEIFLDGVDGVRQDARKEDEADKFALQFLMGGFPLKDYQGKPWPWNEAEIKALSKEYSIHPGILVAQLQRVGSLPNSHLNKLKVKIIF
jgi:addiction module HigA family antidote